MFKKYMEIDKETDFELLKKTEHDFDLLKKHVQLVRNAIIVIIQ